MITTLDEAQEQLRLGIADTLGDNPDVNPDDAAHDLVVGIALDCTPEVALELCRRELGFVPLDLQARLGWKDWLKS